MVDQESKVLVREKLNKQVGLVVGTRPSIVLFAPIIHELRKRNISHFIVHTGQHYSPNMGLQFFKDLNLPEPDYKIEGVADKTTHGGQTAVMLEGVESVLMEEQPTLFLVGGDANTNLAGALAARKLRIQVGHVEAGERSFDWRMPEEHNRRIIDHISEHLFVTGEKGKKHLLTESVQGEIYITGNPKVDASLQHLRVAKETSKALEEFGLTSNEYAILTTHREENVDFPELLRDELEGISQASQKYHFPVLFLAHPRTIKRLHEFGFWEWVNRLPGLDVQPGVGYLDFINLLAHARLVFTDSGGVQQEAAIHQVPAITLRNNTEWIETLETGANRLAGTDPDRIVAATEEALSVECEWSIPFGDGKAAKKIVGIVEKILERN